ncbi:MAG: hypothetical protein ABSH47_12755 [Bryobacteraceae bacterium]|jgi:hypothetical protein
MVKDDVSADEAWRAETLHRVQQIDSGVVRLIPWDDARRRLYEAKLATLRAAVDEGDASGIAAGDVFARVRKTYNLPPNPR